MSASAAIRRSDSLTEKRVLMSERKRTSRGTLGVVTSRVVHQTVAVTPGTSVASMEVWPLEEERLVIRPGEMRTLVWSPGTTSERRALPAAGTGMAEEGG